MDVLKKVPKEEKVRVKKSGSEEKEKKNKTNKTEENANRQS
jgi:hypothetical protein